MIFRQLFTCFGGKKRCVLHFCKKISNFAFWKQPMQNQFKMVLALVFGNVIVKQNLLNISCL